MKVGILDSGIGGLTVLSLAASRMKNTEFIYYADLDNGSSRRYRAGDALSLAGDLVPQVSF